MLRLLLFQLLVLWVGSGGQAAPLRAALVDADDDGLVSLDEYLYGWELEFAARDGDHDGVLSASEQLGDLPHNAAGLIAPANDPSDDEKVSPSEYVRALAAEFESTDLDRNRQLDSFELFQASAVEPRRLTEPELALLDEKLHPLRAELADRLPTERGPLTDETYQAVESWLSRAVAEPIVSLWRLSALADRAAAAAKKCSIVEHREYELTSSRLARAEFSADERHLIELHVHYLADGLMSVRDKPAKLEGFIKLVLATPLVKYWTRAAEARRNVNEAGLDASLTCANLKGAR
jgi:hypothetical protein